MAPLPFSIFPAVAWIPPGFHAVRLRWPAPDGFRCQQSALHPTTHASLRTILVIKSYFAYVLDVQQSQHVVLLLVQGGTAAAPDHLNDRNEAAPEDAWKDLGRCDFVVAVQRHDEPRLLGAQIPAQGCVRLRPASMILNGRRIGPEHVWRFLTGSDEWKLLASEPFVDASHSPALTRALYIPYISQQRNSVAQYQLFQRQGARLG